jgi:S1-C subfamily serine protease
MRKKSTLWKAAAAAAAVAAVLGGVLGPALYEYQHQKPPAADSSQMVNMYDSAAVQFVTNHESADVTWRYAVPNIDALVGFATTDPATVAAWQARDYQTASEDIVHEFLTEPAKYLTPGQAHTTKATETFFGTAWGVSSDGYFVTNHHVTARADKAELIGTAASAGNSAALKAVTAGMVHQLQTIHYGDTGFVLTRSDVSGLFRLADTWLQATSQVSNDDQVLTLSGGPGASPTMEAQVVASSPKTWPYADVAVLKVNAENLPVIPLGSSTALQVGDTVSSIGYPFAATFESYMSDKVPAAPTMATGQVTNRLHTQGGLDAIEHSATQNHGSSGGVLVDAQGRAVGITTAGDTSQDSATAINGGKYFYAVPISAVLPYLRQAGVTPHVSPDQAVYDQAMVYMRDHHYEAAQTLLNKVRGDGFNSPSVTLHAEMDAQAIRDGLNEPIRHPVAVAGHGLAAAGLLVLVGLGAAELYRRRRRTSGTPDGPAFDDGPAGPVDGGPVDGGAAVLVGYRHEQPRLGPVASPATQPVRPVQPAARSGRAARVSEATQPWTFDAEEPTDEPTDEPSRPLVAAASAAQAGQGYGETVVRPRPPAGSGADGPGR